MTVNNTGTPPHILLIMTDQQRADHQSAAGHPVLRTPNIDSLASQGTRFTNAFTNSPLCCPARHSLATGLYPQNSHCWSDPDVLAPDADTYMRRFQEGGYRTGLIGKAHFYWQENIDLKPFERYMHSLGFEDTHETGGTWSNVGADTIYSDYLKGHGLFQTHVDYLSRLDRMPDVERRFLAKASPLPAEHVLDSFIGRTAVQYVKGYNDDRPSFLFVGFQGPHEPWDAPPPYASMYNPDSMPAPITELPPGNWLPEEAQEYARYAQYLQPKDPHKLKEVSANYCGKITLIDDWVGKILEAYHEKGWLEKIAVIFVSDHGEMLGDLNRVSKSVFFESAIRIPLTILLPGNGSQVPCAEGLVELIDLYPTLLELAGCDLPKHTDGRSLLPLIQGEVTNVRDDVLGQVHAHTMIRTMTCKYVVNRDGQGLQLFDLRSDPQEQRNLVGHPKYKGLETEMRDRLLQRLLKSQMILGQRNPVYSAHTSVLTPPPYSAGQILKKILSKRYR